MYVYDKTAPYAKDEKKLIFILVYNIDLNTTNTIQLFDI